jgi:hypothetical protein
MMLGYGESGGQQEICVHVVCALYCYAMCVKREARGLCNGEKGNASESCSHTRYALLDSQSFQLELQVELEVKELLESGFTPARDGLGRRVGCAQFRALPRATRVPRVINPRRWFYFGAAWWRTPRIGAPRIVPATNCVTARARVAGGPIAAACRPGARRYGVSRVDGGGI